MKRKLAVAVLCASLLGGAGGETTPPIDLPTFTPPTPPPPSNVPVLEPLPTLPAPVVDGVGAATPSIPRPETPAVPPVPTPPTFESLVKELEAVRTQKAELEKREKVITESLLKKFAEQKSQLDALGISASPPQPVPAVKGDVPVPALRPVRQ